MAKRGSICPALALALDPVRPMFIFSNIGGSAQPNANAQVLTSFQALLPPLKTQRKIASILSAYDDLIENNNRRIRILEEMAQAIYKEWFVNFRFPGHEKVKMVKSELGMIPEGWVVKKFTEIAYVCSGGTPKTSEPSYWDGNVPFFTPKDVAGDFYVISTEKQITDFGLSKCNSKLYPRNTVFITARGTVGKTVMPDRDMAMNQSCYALVGKEGIDQYYLFLLTLQAVEQLKKETGGATFDTIIIDTFERFNVLSAAPSLIETFFRRVSPVFDSIRSLLNRNAILRKTRDLLLPKLISGEIDVEELNIRVHGIGGVL